MNRQQHYDAAERLLKETPPSIPELLQALTHAVLAAVDVDASRPWRFNTDDDDTLDDASGAQ